MDKVVTDIFAAIQYSYNYLAKSKLAYGKNELLACIKSFRRRVFFPGYIIQHCFQFADLP